MLNEGGVNYPKSIQAYKDLFQKLGLDSENLKGKRAFKMKYDDFLEEKKEETDELCEDQSEFDEFNYESVDYLEDTETAKIYNTQHVHVGVWNEDCDDIIWVSDEFRQQHEDNRP